MHGEINVFYSLRKSGVCNPSSHNYRSLLYREENRNASGTVVSCEVPFKHAANGEHRFVSTLTMLDIT